MFARRSLAKFGLTLSLLTISPVVAMAQTTILNASYDVSRELYKEINPAFSAAYKKDKGADVVVNQSHGGSTKQAQAVANGLEADVVTFNQSTDLDFLVDKGVVAKDWKTKFPNEAAPYTTTTVFIVRKGNPKGIKDWSDLVKEGASVVDSQPEDLGQRTLHLSRGLGLCARDGEERRQGEGVRRQAVRQCARVRRRRPRRNDDVHAARRRRRAGHVRERDRPAQGTSSATSSTSSIRRSASRPRRLSPSSRP